MPGYELIVVRACHGGTPHVETGIGDGSRSADRTMTQLARSPLRKRTLAPRPTESLIRICASNPPRHFAGLCPGTTIVPIVRFGPFVVISAGSERENARQD